MEKQNLTLFNIELYFPLDFISKATAYAEYESQNVLNWEASDGENGKFNISSSQCVNKLKLKLGCMHLHLENETYICDIDKAILSDPVDTVNKTPLSPICQFDCSDNEKQTQTLVSISPLAVHSHINDKKNFRKKRRIRQPKNDSMTSKKESVNKKSKRAPLGDTSENTTNCLTVELISDLENKKSNIDTIISHTDGKSLTVKEEPSEEPLEQSKVKRYGLRGVKLNSDIMCAVKGTHLDSDDTEEGDHDETSRLKFDDDACDDDYMEKHSEAEPSYDKALKYERAKKIKRSRIADDIPKVERRQRRVSNIECKMCSKRLADYTGVYDHVKKNHTRKKGVSTYLEELKTLMIEVCSICGITCSDRKKLMVHEDRVHSKTGPVKCSQCDKIFKNIPTLRTHLRWMHVNEGAKPHQCKVCNAEFKSSTTLKEHVDSIHYGNKYSECDICKKKFYNKSQLRRHLRIHTMDESQKYACTLCGKRFIFSFNLKKHTETVHVAHKESFHCSYCGKGFGQKYGMISHIQLVHFNIFPFSCKLCKATFARSNLFVEHMKSYHKQTDFRVTETLVKNGKYNKSSEDMYYCSYCSEGFMHIARLVEHMHSDHSAAFPCRCEICNQGFLEKVYLSVHKLKAHGIVISDTQSEDSEKENSKLHEILQVITEKEGFSNKLVQLGSKDNIDEDVAVSSEVQAIAEQNPVSEIGGVGSSSLLIEVASGGTTSRYVIEAPDILDESGSVTVAQDIASLLLAAEQTMQEDGEATSADGTTQINVVLDDDQTTYVTSDNTYVGQGQGEPVEESSVITEYSGETIMEESSSMEIQLQNEAGEIQVLTVPVGDNRLTLNGDLLQFAAMETVINSDTPETTTIETESCVDVMES